MTSVGFAAIVDLTGDVNSIAAFDYIANGSNGTAAAAGNTALGAENTTNGLERSRVTPTLVTTSVTNDTLQLQKTWTITGSGTVKEVGVLNASSSGTLLARSVTGATRTVASGDSYQATYKVAAA